jgi:hypothetical protein
MGLNAPCSGVLEKLVVIRLLKKYPFCRTGSSVWQQPATVRYPKPHESISYLGPFSTATSSGLEGRGFDFQQRQKIFLLSTLSRLDLGSTQPAPQWYQGLYSRG